MLFMSRHIQKEQIALLSDEDVIRSHLSVIDFLESSGYLEDQIFHIFAGGLTEKEALIIESKLITFFGCSSEIDPTRTHFHGLRGGLLVNSDISVRPKCVDKMIRRR